MPRINALTRPEIRAAEEYLSKSDSVMSAVIANLGGCDLHKRKNPYFHELVAFIISQQLSAKAANTIEMRFSQYLSRPFQSQDIIELPFADYYRAGLSKAKARYIYELAQRVNSGGLRFTELQILPNEEVTSELMKSPGIGRWTAEMFLLFGLKRPDVFAMSDAGLRRAICMLYNIDKENEARIDNLSRKWSPYRSVASWYLWKHLDAS